LGTEGEPYTEERRNQLLGELIEAEIALHDLKAEATRRHAEIEAEMESNARNLIDEVRDLRAQLFAPVNDPVNEMAAAINGKPKLVAALRAIREAGSLSISEIATAAHLAHNVARGSVAGLVRQGLVRRENGKYVAID